MSEKTEWLSNLKVGDEVVVHSSSMRSIQKISRTTKAQVFIRVNERYEQPFWKKNGYQVGGNIWHQSTLSQPTRQIRDEIELSRLRNKAFSMSQNVVVPKNKDDVIKLIEFLKQYVSAE